MTTEDTAQAFSNLLGDPKQMAFWMILTVVVGFLVCSRGLQNGLEKISKFMMTALLLLIVVLAVHSLTSVSYTHLKSRVLIEKNR